MPRKKNNSNGTKTGALTTDSKHVLIRMYNVGFGDCFLLVFPAPDRPRKVLIDCGVHFLGRNKEVEFNEVVAQLVDHVKERVVESGEERTIPVIDLVIASHRHQDHVLGFANPIWRDVEVGEVWMPWTEDYTDPKALEILTKQHSTGKKLYAVLTAMLVDPKRFGVDKNNQDKIDEIQALKDFSENSLKNADAMEMLHHGFKRGDAIKRQYLPFKERNLNTIKPDFLPKVKVYVMGPSRDPEVIRDMEPGADEHWLRMMNDIGAADFRPLLPFHEDWTKKAEEVDPHYSLLSEKDRKEIENVGEGTELGVAVKLEKAVNGTSLMLMFQIGKAYLFFPGDAQHGTWQAALKDDEWRELLTKTNFYKIGHHGSHNATPKEFVFDVLGADCKAMASVYPVKNFADIPKAELLDALTAKPGEWVRSDKADENKGDPSSFKREKFYVETKIPI
jgi:beta-lactamase superfamily II metal-dependent hydrolase